MPNVDDAAHYLIERRLLTTDAIIDGDVTFTSAVRRNRNLRVTQRSGANYLIKQPDDPSFGGHQTLRCEVSFYSFCQEKPELEPLRSVLPRLLYFDSVQTVVVLELITGTRPLWSYLGQFSAARFPTSAARAIGNALGVMHRLFGRPGRLEDPRLSWLGRDVPWILQAHKPAPQLLETISPANFEALKILQTHGDLSKHLDDLRRIWQPQTVIHNDVKSDNILIRASADSQHPDEIKIWLVDWELVQVGDPAWDLGGALHDFVLFWITSMSPAPSVEAMVQTARYPLPVLQPAIQELWNGYRTAVELPPEESAALLQRAVRYSAARLIQSAFEMSQMSMALPVAPVLLLQVSANLLAQPEAGQVQLYGLFHEVVA